jgi:CheY-like chemotaxis protein
MNEKMNILIVDDQPGKLLTYEAILDELGENLVKAHSGMEALEHLLKTDVALVLMDVSMPGLDGFETAQMIHEHPRFQNTPIVFVSGIHVTDLDRLKGYQHGAVDFSERSKIEAKLEIPSDLGRLPEEMELSIFPFGARVSYERSPPCRKSNGRDFHHSERLIFED